MDLNKSLDINNFTLFMTSIEKDDAELMAHYIICDMTEYHPYETLKYM